MPTLPDGSVVPAHLSVEHTPQTWDGGAFDNVRLRIGEVQEVVYPDDERSRSRRWVEYAVLVQQRQRRTGGAKLYKAVLQANPFGGLADRARWVLRGAKEDRQSPDKVGLGRGSKVLLACVNGETNHAWIVGGGLDPGADDSDAEAMGKHLRATYNGLQVLVDQDGQLAITYGGKTGIDGRVDSGVDSSAPGTYVQLDKDGGFTASTKDSKQSIKLDRKNGKVKIARSSLEIGQATDKMMLGSSFRQAQKQLHNQLLGQLQSLQTLLQTAGSTIVAAAGVPSAPGVPPSGFAPAGAALISAAQLAGQMRQAIQGFEQSAGQKTDFLSDADKIGT